MRARAAGRNPLARRSPSNVRVEGPHILACRWRGTAASTASKRRSRSGISSGARTQWGPWTPSIQPRQRRPPRTSLWPNRRCRRARLRGTLAEAQAAAATSPRDQASGLYQCRVARRRCLAVALRRRRLRRSRQPMAQPRQRMTAALRLHPGRTLSVVTPVRREELRLDVDGQYPQHVVSGTQYSGLTQVVHWIANLTPKGAEPMARLDLVSRRLVGHVPLHQRRRARGARAVCPGHLLGRRRCPAAPRATRTSVRTSTRSSSSSTQQRAPVR